MWNCRYVLQCLAPFPHHPRIKAVFKMNIFGKKEARKNTKISFRTDDETLAHLKSICRIENRTISSLIENILAEHVLLHENPLLAEQEKRLSPRRKCSIPAVAVFRINNGKSYHNCLIVNISANSAQIVLKDLSADEKLEQDFSILFTLPKNDYPILFSCRLARSQCIDHECIVIANFIFDNDKNFELLQNYLSANDVSNS